MLSRVARHLTPGIERLWMRCRSYPKITKILITTPSTPSSTRRMTATRPTLTTRTIGRNLRASNLPTCRGAQDGKRVATFSLLFGALGPLTFFLGCWLIFHDLGESGLRVVFVAPVLNVLGIWLGFAARRRGTRAIGGLILNGLELCIFIGIVVLVTSLLNALSGIH